MRKNGFYVLDLYLDIDNEKRLRLKPYDKRDDYEFNFADLMFTGFPPPIKLTATI
jgi:hypothetical protein